MKNPSNIDGHGYNKSADAYAGHLKFVKKYRNKKTK